MTPHIVAVRAIGSMTVALSFDDGVSGTVDLSTWIGGRGGMFAPLHDPAYFASVTLDEDAGTIVWPNGVDLDPGMLYDAVRGSTQRLSA